ncbi:MAG: hypothetical protein IJ479_05945 [Alphaproteobacteria bacterium]|nr:hypothetical protein [Alphaproteobacteria bacterium]MDY4841039.1 hypothetical protein [Alphaproteobacteria bacterium]
MVTLIIIALIGIAVFQFLTIQEKNKEIEAQDEILRRLKDELKHINGVNKELD